MGSVNSVAFLFQIDQTIPCEEIAHQIQFKKHGSLFKILGNMLVNVHFRVSIYFSVVGTSIY